MRLSKKDIQIIKSTILEYIKDGKIYLFGSRVDDSKKGGDIDLLVETQQNIGLKEELEILSKLELNGIIRKVDLLIKTPFRKQNAIFDSIESTKVAL
ncbi:MAG: nucleotidyltransferase domain-containing protein [Campylobacterales bacterium]|nr:nucleotidyltransferase domain-containing protein [Campylobacterales bacterium]